MSLRLGHSGGGREGAGWVQPESAWFSTSWVPSYLALGKDQVRCAQLSSQFCLRHGLSELTFYSMVLLKMIKEIQVIQTSLGK